MADSQHGDSATVTTFPARYYFTFSSKLRSLATTPIHAQHPRGARCQVAFAASQTENVHTKEAEYQRAWNARALDGEFKVTGDGDDRKVVPPQGARDRLWNGLRGKTLSGGDFILVRSDGVIELDGRFTLRAYPDDTLIDVVYGGMVDLADPSLSVPGRDRRTAGDSIEARVAEVFEDFIHGRLALRGDDGLKLPVQLTITFELTTGPWSDSAGEDTSWMEERYRKVQEHVWRYLTLTRQRFIGVGQIEFAPLQRGQLPAAEWIEVDVYGLEAATRSFPPVVAS